MMFSGLPDLDSPIMIRWERQFSCNRKRSRYFIGDFRQEVACLPGLQARL